jgi:hypothetical protein
MKEIPATDRSFQPFRSARLEKRSDRAQGEEGYREGPPASFPEWSS